MPSISDIHVDLATRKTQWAKIRTVIEGEDAVKLAGATYLPQPSGQDLTMYTAYKERATFYPAVGRTLLGLTGLVFRNQPTIALPDRMLPIADNMTVDGYPAAVLLTDMVTELLSVGRYGILVDYPAESSTTALPCFATYKAENIINWQHTIVNGRRTLSRLVLEDEGDDDSINEIEQYLELLLLDGVYTVNRYQRSTSGGADVLLDSRAPRVAGRTLSAIPFVGVTPYSLTVVPPKPPALDLVNVNLGHWRNSADYEHALFLTAQPTPYVCADIVEADKPRAIGSSVVWYLPQGASVGMLEFTGAGLSAQRQALLDKEARLAALGARMIKDSAPAAETAETAKLRARGENSLLMSTISMVEAGLTAALGIVADWVGASRDDIKVTLNRDLVDASLSAQELTALVAAWQSGAISHETLHENLQRGEIMPVTRSFDDEKEAIAAEALTPPTAAAQLRNMAGGQ